MTVVLTDPELTRHAERVAADGYTVLEDVIDAQHLDELASEVARLTAELGIVPADNLFEGRSTTRIYNLLARGKVFERVAEHPAVLPLVERVLDRGCLVSSLSSIAIAPGEVAQPLHADDQIVPLPRPHVPIVCNTMWAITDFTEENGATRIVPGSHTAPAPPEPFGDQPTVSVVMRRGSVLVYNGSLWHGGGANRSTETRLGIAMNYCAGWIRQQENQQLGIPLEIARGFSTRLRKLAGFGLYKRLLGHIDKCSPEDLLDATGPRPIVGKLG
jgi:ectoine hydroxylase-related dioxygenase (phytanoyl-CoA dioxygenase family)